MSIPIALFLATVLYLIYYYLIHPIFLSPLSKIPNAHFSSSFSPLWILWIRRKGFENRTRLSCHEKLGPVIRLGPNEIGVNCVEGGIRTVYGGAFEKHDWYPNLFCNYGVPNMFSVTQNKPHSLRKRMMSHVYSKSHLQNSPEVHSISQTLLFKRLLPIVESLAESRTPMDVLELNYSVSMDFTSAYLFGLGNGSNFLEDVPFRRHFLKIWQRRKMYEFWPQELPKLTRFLRKVGLMLVPTYVDAISSEIEAWCLSMCNAVTSAEEKSSENSEEAKSVVCDQMSNSLSKSYNTANQEIAQYPRNLLIATEMLDELAAGHETSGITLTYLMYELSQRPELQRTLRTELLSLSPPICFPPSSLPIEQDLPSLRFIDTLPLLDALLFETLRLHTAVPGPQPRVTPSTLTTLGPFANIPPNVRVSAMAYSLHRNKDIFPEPEKWDPNRWLEASKEEREDMGRWFWAFGSGSRMCIGRNFAVQEMKLVIASIYTNYTTEIINGAGMEHLDNFVAGPVEGKLVLSFSRVCSE